MLSGSSEAVSDRLTVSIAAMKAAPRDRETGISFRLSWPTIILEMCGMTSPTQPTEPHMQTAPAVASVAPAMTSRFVHFTSTPSVRASRSPIDRTLIRQLMHSSTSRPTHTGRMAHRPSQPTEARLPMSQ